MQHKDTQIKNLKHHHNCDKDETLQRTCDRLTETYWAEMIKWGEHVGGWVGFVGCAGWGRVGLVLVCMSIHVCAHVVLS